MEFQFVNHSRVKVSDFKSDAQQMGISISSFKDRDNQNCISLSKSFSDLNDRQKVENDLRLMYDKMSARK